jgi:hypothetical protein
MPITSPFVSTPTRKSKQGKVPTPSKPLQPPVRVRSKLHGVLAAGLPASTCLGSSEDRQESLDVVCWMLLHIALNALNRKNGSRKGMSNLNFEIYTPTGEFTATQTPLLLPPASSAEMAALATPNRISLANELSFGQYIDVVDAMSVLTHSTRVLVKVDSTPLRVVPNRILPAERAFDEPAVLRSVLAGCGAFD